MSERTPPDNFVVPPAATNLTVIQSPAPKTLPESLRALASTYQGIGELIPADLAPLVGPALAQARRAIIPAGERTLAMELARLFEWARLFGIDFKTNIAAKAFQPLADLPADLLTQAVTRIMQTHKFGMRLPMLSEITATVSHELQERNNLIHRLGRLAYAVKRGDITKPRKPKVKMTEAEQAAFDDAMAKLRARQMDAKADVTRYPTRPKVSHASVRLPYADDSVELGAEFLDVAKNG
jgi:hypothetical protein